jgi:dTDP-4-dehydrorhamnose reductase/dTDP-4-dehydrorhamnose 3,5-epimerase
MKIRETPLQGLWLLEPLVHGDHRGWFMESYSKKQLAPCGVDVEFVQDNHSYSARKGVLRGLHFQIPPAAQTKLVRCTRGAVLDVAVDLRRDSATYKRWYKAELTAANWKMLLISAGFAHAFLTLEDDTEIQYKVDAYYAPEYERGIRYDDPDIGIDWGDVSPVLSEKDARAPLLRDCDVLF